MKQLKISVIICSIEALKYARICENYKRLLADVPYEIIGIHDAKSLGEGYNRGIQKSTGEILIFSHDDILILDGHFAEKVIARLSKFDLLGFAGASRLVDGKWIGATNQYLHGAIAHALPKSSSLTLNVYGVNDWPIISGIKVIDGLCMIAKREVATRIGFDAETFDGFHLYDLDFSFASYLAGFNLGICCDIPTIHESGGNFDSKYREYALRFVNKYIEHFDPPEYGRPSTMQLGNASSFRDTDALLRGWQKDSLKQITTTILSAAAFEQTHAPRCNPAPTAKQLSEEESKRFFAIQHLNVTPPDNESLNAFSKIDIPNQVSKEWVESRTLSSFNQNYHNWLAQRIFIKSDTKFLENQSSASGKGLTGFHLIIRHTTGFDEQLADTIDSLGQQIHDAWQLDVISTLPGPEGLEDIPNIGWHTLNAEVNFKKTADLIGQKSPYDWLIEIPPGAKLDILYFWRLSNEISIFPDTFAFFVDDDCCDKSGKRHSPRFKPGTNPSYLQSSDLAGPLCVHKDAWFAIGGASVSNRSPWFDQLLRITDRFGWGAIQHIPDVLVTYSNSFQSDPESCHLALADSLKTKGIEGEIRSITSQSWEVRHALKNPPTVTIAILSTGQLELISRCLASTLQFTRYPAYELLIVTNRVDSDPGFDRWLTDIKTGSQFPIIRTVHVNSDANHAVRCNAAIASSDNELVVLTREETVFVQDIWLHELVASLQQPNIIAASPLVHQAGDAKILTSGNTLGLLGECASPYAGKASLGEAGYLDFLQVTRDSIALPSSCFLTHKTAYQDVGGMDEIALGDHFADIDFCLKLRKNNHRLIVHPRASVVYGGDSSQYDLKQRQEATLKKMSATEVFRQRWGAAAVVDPYWNVNLSLSSTIPIPETEYRAQWQYLPSNKPRILAHPLGNGQGDFRVTSPLSAARKAGLASECVWRQKVTNSVRYFTAAEIARLAPTTVIIQNYIHDIALSVLNDWNSLKNRPFIVYTLDDLINDLNKTNPFRKFIPPNARSRLKYALTNCDRLVVSTDFLAESYRHFIKDIKVVPNRLEKDIWLPLNSLKRASKKPRVGWAGGSTHEGDLILLKEIIEQTREEVDWIFFGMCPDVIRPLITEFHDLVPFYEYPAYLASLNLDIAVAPLTTSPFNQGKSNLRLLEYGALGIPVVCTDIDPYRNSPACRVENSAKSWVAALRERIYDAEGREKEGMAMRDWVYRSYLLEEHLDEWLSAHLPS